MSKTLFVKLAQKKYEKRRKKVESFIEDFTKENSVRIEEIGTHRTADLIESIEEICYEYQDIMTNDDIAKIIVVMNTLKNLYKN